MYDTYKQLYHKRKGEKKAKYGRSMYVSMYNQQEFDIQAEVYAREQGIDINTKDGQMKVIKELVDYQTSQMSKKQAQVYKKVLNQRGTEKQKEKSWREIFMEDEFDQINSQINDWIGEIEAANPGASSYEIRAIVGQSIFGSP